MIPKFRFWDREKGCFVDDSLYLDSWGNVYRDVTVDFFGPEAIENPIRPLECIEVMQSTGLFDKNGNEIFEGDVVKLKYTITSDYEFFKVSRFRGGAWRIDNRRRGCELWLRNEDCETVGNVYENPELMEVSDGCKN